MLRFTQAFVACALLSITAKAEVDLAGGGDSGGPFTITDANGQIGEIMVTRNTPPSGYSANLEYWKWTDTAWPSNDFRLEPDDNASPTPSTSDVYYSADFPSSATQQLPGSLGQGNKMYAISACDASNNCTNAGFLWVISGGSTLKWFLRSDWEGDRITPIGEDGYIHFDHLVSAPGTQDYFRYLAHDQH